MIRVHREHTQQLSVASGDEQLTQLKWPIETLFMQFRPITNGDDANNSNSFTEWYKGTSISKERSDCITSFAATAAVTAFASAISVREENCCQALTYDVVTETCRYN